VKAVCKVKQQTRAPESGERRWYRRLSPLYLPLVSVIRTFWRYRQLIVRVLFFISQTFTAANFVALGIVAYDRGFVTPWVGSVNKKTNSPL
jgi:hypothetical protein